MPARSISVMHGRNRFLVFLSLLYASTASTPRLSTIERRRRAHTNARALPPLAFDPSRPCHAYRGRTILTSTWRDYTLFPRMTHSATDEEVCSWSSAGPVSAAAASSPSGRWVWVRRRHRQGEPLLLLCGGDDGGGRGGGESVVRFDDDVIVHALYEANSQSTATRRTSGSGTVDGIRVTSGTSGTSGPSSSRSGPNSSPNSSPNPSPSPSTQTTIDPPRGSPRMWMSYTPNEVLTLMPLVHRARGVTVVVGLGIGWLLHEVSWHPKVGKRRDEERRNYSACCMAVCCVLCAVRLCAFVCCVLCAVPHWFCTMRVDNMCDSLSVKGHQTHPHRARRGASGMADAPPPAYLKPMAPHVVGRTHRRCL